MVIVSPKLAGAFAALINLPCAISQKNLRVQDVRRDKDLPQLL